MFYNRVNLFNIGRMNDQYSTSQNIGFVNLFCLESKQDVEHLQGFGTKLAETLLDFSSASSSNLHDRKIKPAWVIVQWIALHFATEMGDERTQYTQNTCIYIYYILVIWEYYIYTLYIPCVE